jgi:RNA polymerase sigma-70 factor (ECF subfamily)
MLEAPDPIAVTDDPSEQVILSRQLHQVLEWIRGEFEERTWRAFWLVQMENRDSGDVAKELAMTAAAVRKAKYRVLHRLRQELEGLDT